MDTKRSNPKLEALPLVSGGSGQVTAVRRSGYPIWPRGLATRFGYAAWARRWLAL